MDWSGFLYSVIVGIISTLISGIFVYFFKKFVGERLKAQASDEITKANIDTPILKNPFLVMLFITVFAIVLTFSTMILGWATDKQVYFIFVDMGLAYVTYWVYNDQCPSCNRLFKKKFIKKETISEEKRPYIYRKCTIYLYSDGSEKARKYTGSEKTIQETWRTEKEFYECQACSYRWDKIFTRNLDINNRPKPDVVRTKTRPPVQ